MSSKDIKPQTSFGFEPDNDSVSGGTAPAPEGVILPYPTPKSQTEVDENQAYLDYLLTLKKDKQDDEIG